MKKNIIICALITALTAISMVAIGGPCQGKTKAGASCKAHSTKGTTFCVNHNPSAIHCGAVTKAGQPCKRVVKAAGTHCSSHQGK